MGKFKDVVSLVSNISVIIAVLFYLLSGDEKTDVGVIDYMDKYIDLQEKVDSLTIQKHKYEIEILENNASISSMSSNERDSLRAILNPK